MIHYDYIYCCWLSDTTCIHTSTLTMRRSTVSVVWWRWHYAAAETCFIVCRRSRAVDAEQSSPVECCKDRVPLVLVATPSTPDSRHAAQCWCRRYHSSSQRTKSRYLHWFRISMSTHVSKTVSSCFSALRQIRSIRRSVSRPVLLSLVVSMVLTRLDYGRAALAGLPGQLLDKLQSVLNAAALLVCSARKYDHITPCSVICIGCRIQSVSRFAWQFWLIGASTA